MSNSERKPTVVRGWSWGGIAPGPEAGWGWGP
jgi:hypothetical protein